MQDDEITVSGDNKTVYLADPVHKYDIAKLYQFVTDNFAKLSGDNDISGGNSFHGANLFDGELSVGFDKLFDIRDGKSLEKLSGEISAEIENLSVALSGEIDKLSAALSGEIDSLSVALSGEIDSLSVALSSEISSRAMISVDGNSITEFKLRHISQDDYHNLVLSVGGTVDPNTVYVVSSDGWSMYGEKITDLADGENPSDAVTYRQLSSSGGGYVRKSIYDAIDEILPSDRLEDNLSIDLSAVILCLMNIRAALSSES